MLGQEDLDVLLNKTRLLLCCMADAHYIAAAAAVVVYVTFREIGALEIPPYALRHVDGGSRQSERQSSSRPESIAIEPN
jgi:hypothetical protein